MAKTFAGCLDNVIFLQAIYPFSGSDEDELSFNKSDVIVVTKKDDGGWWEGTLDGKIGWFPCNYGKEIPADPVPTPAELPESHCTQETSDYHNLVVENIVNTQKKHIEELKGFLDKYLIPVQTSSLLTQTDRDTLCGNYGEIVSFHEDLCNQFEVESKKPIPQQRFGECLLNLSGKMKELYLSYCSNHPQAANLISLYGDELGAFMESIGASSPGIMTLTSFLSKPFIHVGKYVNQIKELERHVEENHIDNLDMRKATQVLQIITLSCNDLRKKKEMELQMLTGTIDGWQGEPITSLGNLVHMGQVFVEKEGVPRRERYFCVFPNDLVVLSVGAELSGYCFEERYKMEKVSAMNVEDSENFFNGFHLTVEEIVWQVMTSSPREKDSWMDALKKVLGERCILELKIKELLKPAASNLERSDSKRSEVRSLPMLDVNSDGAPFKRSYSAGASIILSNQPKPPRSADSSPVPPQEIQLKSSSQLSAVRSSVRQPVKKEWSFTRLRPTPPYQQNNVKTADESSPRAMRRIVSAKKIVGGRGVKDDFDDSAFSRKQSTPSISSTLDSPRQILEEDMMILSVIEAYCFSTRQRQNVSSSSSSPYWMDFVNFTDTNNNTTTQAHKSSSYTCKTPITHAQTRPMKSSESFQNNVPPLLKSVSSGDATPPSKNTAEQNAHSTPHSQNAAEKFAQNYATYSFNDSDEEPLIKRRPSIRDKIMSKTCICYPNKMTTTRK